MTASKAICPYFCIKGVHIMRAYRERALFVAAALAAAGAGAFVAVRTMGASAGDERVGHSPTASDPATADGEKAIRNTQSAYVKAFNAGDAEALAAFWTLDGEFVDASGRSFRGRSAIQKEFAAFFGEAKGSKLDISMDSLRFVAPGVALETGTSRVTHPTDASGNSAGYSIVHTRRDGRWLLASVREMPHIPSSNYERLRDLEWLVGAWAAKGGGNTLELTCEWTAKRNFLTRKYSLQGPDGATKTGIQIIGWDPVKAAHPLR
jgi:uncharacterized protein (TIGR02246 family)